MREDTTDAHVLSKEQDKLARLRKIGNYEFFENIASRWTGHRRKHNYYWEEITKYLDYFSHEEIKVLEVGCGTGDLIGSIRGARKVGIDFSPSMIEVAKKRFPDVEFHIMAAEEILLNEKFDFVILSNLIGYPNDLQEVFEQLHKVCHPYTKVAVQYYNHAWEPLLKLAEKLGLKMKMPIQNWLTIPDVNNLLYLADFDVYRNSRRMLFPINIPLIAPLFNRFLVKLPLIRKLGINSYSFAKPFARIPKAVYAEKYSTSVVIPARNESGNIEEAILRMPKFGKEVEIIFVEGNSTDDTWERIQEIAAKYSATHTIKVTQQEGKGKGDAVRKGFGIATGDILMILDADLTVPPEDLPKFYEAIASGKGDFINGSRLVYKMEKNAMRFLNRLGNKFFSNTFSWLLDQRFKDTLCGTKVIFREDYLKLIGNRRFFGEFDPFGDYDLIFGAYKIES